MKDETLIQITRLFCGASLLIAGKILEVDGIILAISIFLMGIPVELVQKKSE